MVYGEKRFAKLANKPEEFIFFSVCNRRLSAGFAEFRRQAYEKFEIYAGHGVGEHREIVLVEEVVDGQFQLNVQRPERQALFQRYDAHEILGQVSGECGRCSTW